MKAMRWRSVFPGFLMALWLSLFLTTAIYASSVFKPHSDDCLNYLRNPANVVLAPRAMIEDCQRTALPAGIAAGIIAAVLGGLLGAEAAAAVGRATRTPPQEAVDSDNEWVTRMAYEAWVRASKFDPAPFRSVPADQLDRVQQRMQGLQLRYGNPDRVPSSEFPGSGQGNIVSGQAARDWLVNHGAATVTGPDGRTYIRTSAINDLPQLQGGAYHTTTINGVEVIDPSQEVAILQR
jgi:hypothetical protein